MYGDLQTWTSVLVSYVLPSAAYTGLMVVFAVRDLKKRRRLVPMLRWMLPLTIADMSWFGWRYRVPLGSLLLDMAIVSAGGIALIVLLDRITRPAWDRWVASSEGRGNGADTTAHEPPPEADCAAR